MSDAGVDRPRGHSPFGGLTFQLFILTILPLTALLLAITFGSLGLHQQAMRSLVGERDMLAVHTAAAALERQTAQHANTLLLIAAQVGGVEPATGSNLAALMEKYVFLQEDFDRGLAIIAPDGDLLALHGRRAFWEAAAEGLGDFAADMQDGGTDPLIIPNHFFDPDTGEQVLVMLAPPAEGEYLVAGAVTAAGLAQRVFSETMLEGHHTTFTLVGADSSLIYQAGHLLYEGPIAEHAGVQEALRGESGATYKQAGESEHVIAYSPIPLLGWGLISEEPWEMVDSPTLRATQIAPLILVPALFLMLLALGFAVRQIVRPLQDLQARAGMLAQGNYEAIEIPVGGIEEIRRLQSGLVHMAHEVRAAQQNLHRYIGAITSAQEDERRRLARDLHDDTIQALIALKQRVDLARLDLRAAGESAPLEEIAGLTETTIENLRRLTRALRPIYLEDLGLSTALEMLVHETSQAAGITITFERRGEARRLPPDVELALYRIAQEALNNVTRHAGASSASVCLVFDPQVSSLEVSDDGKGFTYPANPAEFALAGHYGLLGMHERADLIGGQLEIRSVPGEGTHLRVHLKMKNDQ